MSEERFRSCGRRETVRLPDASIRFAIAAPRYLAASIRGPLEDLYRDVELQGAFAALRDCHRALDRAVADAYGWPATVTGDNDDTLRRLLARNLAVAAGELPYAGP